MIYVGRDVHKDSITIAVLPQTSIDLKRRQEGQPPAVIGHAWKAQQRLHARFNHLSYRKRPQIAVVAVDRELVGFLWAVMRELEPVHAA